MRSAREVAERLAALYPGARLVARGVVHITVTVHPSGDPRGVRHVLAVGPHAPPSDHDFFALCATRARADALLTSAGNVRAEPGLHHDAPPDWADALVDYRAALGKTAAPTLAILTASGDIPLDHGLWGDHTHKLVITSQRALPALTHRLAGRAELVGLAEPSAAAAIALLKARGHALISLEAGPSTLAPLYSAGTPHAVDELLLHTFEAPLPDPLGLGPALPADSALLAGLTCVGESTLREPSGPFRFACYQRR
jgi:riboflavin biosynthesis pyrimidine reductase